MALNTQHAQFTRYADGSLHIVTVGGTDPRLSGDDVGRLAAYLRETSAGLDKAHSTNVTSWKAHDDGLTAAEEDARLAVSDANTLVPVRPEKAESDNDYAFLGLQPGADPTAVATALARHARDYTPKPSPEDEAKAKADAALAAHTDPQSKEAAKQAAALAAKHHDDDGQLVAEEATKGRNRRIDAIKAGGGPTFGDTEDKLKAVGRLAAHQTKADVSFKDK